MEAPVSLPAISKPTVPATIATHKAEDRFVAHKPEPSQTVVTPASAAPAKVLKPVAQPLELGVFADDTKPSIFTAAATTGDEESSKRASKSPDKKSSSASKKSGKDDSSSSKERSAKGEKRKSGSRDKEDKEARVKKERSDRPAKKQGKEILAVGGDDDNSADRDAVVVLTEEQRADGQREEVRGEAPGHLLPGIRRCAGLGLGRAGRV